MLVHMWKLDCKRLFQSKISRRSHRLQTLPTAGDCHFVMACVRSQTEEAVPLSATKQQLQHAVSVASFVCHVVLACEWIENVTVRYQYHRHMQQRCRVHCAFWLQLYRHQLKRQRNRRRLCEPKFQRPRHYGRRCRWLSAMINSSNSSVLGWKVSFGYAGLSTLHSQANVT